MAAELIRSYKDERFGKHTIYVYGCSMCGAEVYLRKRIPGKETYCGGCMKIRTIKRCENRDKRLQRDAIGKYVPRMKALLTLQGEALKESIETIIRDMENE